MKTNSEDEIAELLVLFIQGKLSSQQAEALEEWKDASPQNRRQFNELTNARVLKQKLKNYAEAMKMNVAQERKATPVLRLIRSAWFRVAAAAAVIITFVFLLRQDSDKGGNGGSGAGLGIQKLPVVTENSPVLVLADGTTILLDSAINGKLTSQGGIEISKSGDGQIVYKTRQGSHEEITGVNTIRTPRGKRYKLVLPDGSTVWLNAASSITFPPKFSDTERVVSMEGEVYLEVAKNARRPFRVNMKNGSTIEVLGTTFDINAYDDEPMIRATLVEGSVRVARGTQHEMLKPGEQALFTSTGKIKVDEHVNIEQVIAWTKDKLAINSADFKGLMREISRWYDVDVVFEGTVPELRVGGFIQRDVNISTVLEFLKGNGVSYKFDGKILRIL